MSKSEFVQLSLPSLLGDDQNYDNSKIKKRSCWRWWKQQSRFQRSLFSISAVLFFVALIYLFPAWRSVNLLNIHSRKFSFDKTQKTMTSKYPDKLSVVELEEQNDHQIPEPNMKITGSEEQQQQQQQQGDEKVPELVEPLELNENEESLRHLPRFPGPTNPQQRAVVDAFKHAWNGYKKYAWGHDNLKPVSKTYSDWFGMGLTIIDAIDTAYIMGLKKEYQEARTFIADVLTFDINKDVNLFETTIRVLGGLLSAYHLTKDWLFIDKAVDLGDRLLPCFNTRSGIPYSDVNLQSHRSHPPRWGPDSSVSEVSTIQLEFKDLSRITGNSKYEKAVDKVSLHLHNQPKQDGLVPIFINAETGNFRSFTTITLGARGDSYYEYLLKQWIQTGKTNDMLLQDYNGSVSGIIKNLLKYSEPNKLAYVGELANSKHFKPKMDHLVCYLPSVLVLGYHNGLPEEHYKLARELAYTCYQMYAQMPTFLSPEIVHFNMNPSSDKDLFVKVADTHNLLRPETIESLWYLYHFTNNKTYQDWGWQIFQAFEKYTKVPGGGYTSIENVKNPENPQPKDMMETFFLGETLKYFYLLFSDDQKALSLDKWVFNSEAHPLPIYP